MAEIINDPLQDVKDENILLNFEFKFYLRKMTAPDKIYDLSLSESITDSWTTNTTDVIRYKYKGTTGKLATSANFQISLTGVNDQNDDTYKLFKSLYGGPIHDLQGYEVQMIFPDVEGETKGKTVTCPVSISYTSGFAAGANDVAKFGIDLFANGAIRLDEEAWTIKK